MKNLKKIMALVIAVVMCIAMGTIAFAAADYSITVNNAKAGETYTAYKMFDLSVDDPENPTAFRYTVNSAWATFANTDEFKKIFAVDTQGYVTTTQKDQPAWSGTSDFSILADKAAEFAAENKIAGAGSITIAENSTSGKIELDGAGYYVVSSTLGSRAMIESTPSDSAVTINEKNEEDTIDKKVQEDSTSAWGTQNDAQVGDSVSFKSEATIAARSINVVIHDTMDNGLTLDESSIKVYTDADMQNVYSAATIKTGTNAAPDTFTIEIPDSFAATATSSQTLYIAYSATINENAVVTDDNGVAIVDQKNKTKVSFGNNTSSTEKETTTTTHKFSVFKHAAGSTENLAGAIFKVSIPATTTTVDQETSEETTSTTYTDLKLIKLDDNNYRIAKDGETGAVDTFTTVAEGDIVIWGVDADTYSLTEVTAPAGYNLLAAPVDVTVDAGNATRIDIVNNTGAELPSTGGIGTTIFYVIGAILVVAAGVLLVTRRRIKE